MSWIPLLGEGVNNTRTDVCPPPPFVGDSNYDESLYVQAISPLLISAGFNAHFITDQGRSGKQPTGQLAWGDWCNVIGKTSRGA